MMAFWRCANKQHCLLLVLFVMVVVALRGFAYWGRAYPSGADYGHHLFYAEQVLATGALPISLPYFQMGVTEWSVLPGGSMIYALTAAFSGSPVIRVGAITLVFSAIEVIGVYLLGVVIFRRRAPALTAAAFTALSPAGAEMLAWSGYPNAIALALLPYVFAALLLYWQSPTRRALLLAALVTGGMVSIHHLSTLWAGLTLMLFGALHTLIEPIRSMKKLIPLAGAGLLIGLPILIKIYDVSTGNEMTAVLLSGSRYDETRLNWSLWSETASAPMFVFAVGGTLALLTAPGIQRAARLLMLAYGAVCGVFAFGWVVGLNFAYVRATFFIMLIGALGAAALLDRWRSASVRVALTLALLAVVGVGAFIRAQPLTDYFAALTPRTIEGALWLRDHSSAEDVVVVGTYYGYHMTRLLERRTLVAHAPDLVGNPAEAPLADAGFAIMMGLRDIDAALTQYNVRYVIVKAAAPDIPDPARSRAIMDAHPHMRLIFRNAAMLIYAVEPPP